MDNIDQNQEFKYENKTLVLLPGSFKPPHKGHWQMVLDNLPIADEIHIFISNTSTKYISNRKLSLSNLKKLGKLKQFAEENLNSEEITKIFKDLDEQIDNLTFNQLKEKLNELLNLNYADDEVSQEFKSQVQTYLKELEEKLFKSIRYTAAGTEIVPETAEEIFNMYINDYGLQDKVFVHISQAASPMLAAVGFANNNCLDCDLFIGSHTEDEANERSKQLDQLTKAFAYNPSNRIHLLPVSEKIQAARDIRANINNLNKNMFPSKITEETYNKIIELLTNNIQENRMKKNKFDLVYESLMNGIKSSVINEGGNAFDNVGPIYKENIQPTIDLLNKMIFKPLNITEDCWTSELGSVGKKAKSGDIDIALLMPKLRELLQIESDDEIKQLIIDQLNLHDIPNRKIGVNIHMSFPIQGTQLGENVQIDFIPSEDLEYTKFINHSPSDTESKYKGAHRSNGLKQLIKCVSMVIADDAQDNEKQSYTDPNGLVYPGLRFKYISAKPDGFYYVTKSFLGKRGNVVKTPKTIKEQDKFLTRNPQEVLDLLFGKDKYNYSDCHSFETIWNNILMDPTFPYKDQLNNILNALYQMYEKDIYIDPPIELTEYLGK